MRGDCCVMVFLLLVGGGWGCTEVPQAQFEPVDPAQVSERPPAPSPRGRARPFGADCSDGSECQSGVCLHVDQESRLEGRRCSQACGGVACESGHCVQIYPSDDGWFCVPEAR